MAAKRKLNLIDVVRLIRQPKTAGEVDFEAKKRQAKELNLSPDQTVEYLTGLKSKDENPLARFKAISDVDREPIDQSMFARLTGVFPEEEQDKFSLTEPLDVKRTLTGVEEFRKGGGKFIGQTPTLPKREKPTGGEPKLPTQTVLDSQYMQDLMKEGMTRKQAYEKLQGMKRNQSLDAFINSILDEGTSSAFTPPPGWEQLTPEEQADYKKLKGIQ